MLNTMTTDTSFLRIFFSLYCVFTENLVFIHQVFFLWQVNFSLIQGHRSMKSFC